MKKRINISINEKLIEELKKYNKYNLPFSKQIEILITNFLTAQKQPKKQDYNNKKVDYKNGIYFIEENNNFEYDPTLDD